MECNISELVDNFDAGLKHLKKNEVFSCIYNQLGHIDFRTRELTFEALIEIIVSQMLSNNVADVIFGRIKSLFKDHNQIDPKEMIIVDREILRSTGISYSKVSFIHDLSKTFIDNPKIIQNWKSLNHEKVYIEIKKLNGFGSWSAEIILLLYLGKKDVFPFGDSTLKKAHANIYGIPLSKNLEEINWAKPYRSILALYFWGWVDNGMIKPLKNP